ncbi:metallophosphoesterase family protein [Actinocrinis puniceicyclus]|uniref:Metallophosphoesterase family protein n=1 Tax=Actinocrinis puniceicyclus TaxID=977794 RepID=A0A8J8BBU2_9ACTN|nr:metallophosphoesterase family protein [Actinocrinis puniceicyclus]
MDASEPGTGFSRRSALRAAVVGGALAGTSTGPAVSANAASEPPTSAASEPVTSALLWRQPERLGAPPVDGLHLTFGADPCREMYVSWSTVTPVAKARVRYGTADGGFGHEVRAETRTYIDAASTREVYVHHAQLTDLRPDTTYIYAALADGALPDAGTFRTAPTGRAPFTFTSFGDQSVPSVAWLPGAGSGTYSAGISGLASPAAADIVYGIEQVRPLFHLLNGDLCYANLSDDRVRTWNSFFANNTRSTRYRPWMPAAGNHENERGNGLIGYQAYLTRFALPGNGSADWNGLWYAFTVCGVRVIVLQNDDVALQDAGDAYVSGYSGGEQRAWLERQLKAARSSRQIDWIVVCMHQVMVSSSDANGADLGIRLNWGPLFDRYEVDLVLCGHEHDYERSLAVRGVIPGSETLTPEPVSANTGHIDTGQGTVHMVLGGGGTNSPSNSKFFTDGTGKVITAVGAPGANGKKTPTYVFEQAVWSAFRDLTHPYGFAAFEVDPGNRPGGQTSIRVTYYTVAQPDGAIAPLESFTLHRRRSDG